jgi:hypothetical protein
MASADQLKALVDSFIEGDEQRFFAVAMQVAAHEAKLGHGKLAEDIRAAIDRAKGRRGAASTIPISRPRGELANILTVSYPQVRLSHMVSKSSSRDFRTLNLPSRVWLVNVQVSSF